MIGASCHEGSVMLDSTLAAMPRERARGRVDEMVELMPAIHSFLAADELQRGPRAGEGVHSDCRRPAAMPKQTPRPAIK